MSMLAFPFDSRVEVIENPITHEPETQFDRAISSQPMRHLMRKLFTTGIMPDLSDNYLVSAGTAGMTVVVHSGFAVVDGGLALETEDRTLEVQAAETSLDRIDTVVLRWNENIDVRSADLYVVKGTPAASPVRPQLQRDESIYEIGLADLFITRSTSTITNEKITDTRYDTARCGVVRSISEYDTTYIYQQVQADLASFKANEQADFIAWFNSIQDILDEHVAARLQAEIDAINANLTATYNGDDIPFKFGIDPTTGDYGYIKAGADTVTPFKSSHTDTITPVIRDMIDMGIYHKVRYVDLSAVPNVNTLTYTFPANDTGATKDLGATNSYRYVNAANVYAKGSADGGASVRTQVSTWVRNRVAAYNAGVSGWGNINSQTDANNYVDVAYNQGVANGKAAVVPAYYSIAPAGQQTYYYNGGGTTVNGGCKITLGAATISRNGNVLTISIPESIYSYGGYENQGVTTNRNITLTCTM